VRAWPLWRQRWEWAYARAYESNDSRTGELERWLHHYTYHRPHMAHGVTACQAGALLGALMDLVSCVACVSSWYSVIVAETHETVHAESGMRYQPALSLDPSSDRRLKALTRVI